MVQVEQISDLDFLGGVFVEIEQQFVQADYRNLLEQTIDDLEEDHAEYFAGEHTPDGDPWPALSPVTIKKKGHAIILREFDSMRDSLIDRTRDSIRDVISEAPNHSLTFGTMDEKSPYHMEGTERMPKREHVGLTEPRCNAIAENTADATVELLMPRR
jgi:hypothetical protein